MIMCRVDDFIPDINNALCGHGDNNKVLEARAGIEPALKDLQSSTSPFCHRARGNSQEVIVIPAKSLAGYMFW